MTTGGAHMVTASELMQWGVPENTIWNALKRNRERGGAGSWAHQPAPAGSGAKVLISYASIPADTREKYALPALEQLATNHTDAALRAAHAGTRASLRTSAGLVAFDYFHFKSGANYADAAQLADSAAWLELLHRATGKTAVRALRVPGLDSKADLMAAVLRLVMADKPRGLRVTNVQVLKRAQAAWGGARAQGMEAALASLVARATRNAGATQNARKLNDHAKRLLLALYLNPGQDVKLAPVQVAHIYNGIAGGSRQAYDRATGELLFEGDTAGSEALPTLSERTITTFLAHPDTLAVAARERNGTKFYKDWVRPYVSRSKPNYSLSLVSADGQHLGLYVKDGQDVSWKRPVAYPVFDVKSGAIVGASLGEAETKPLLRAALADLLTNTAGRLPMEIQVDNFLKIGLGEGEEIAATVHYCQPFNPQSKFAERFIGQFEQEVLRLVPGWVGGNIEDVSSKQKRNKDYDRVGYTWPELRTLYADLVRQWNHTPRKELAGRTRWQVLEASYNPGCEIMPAARQAVLFGDDTIVSVSRGALKLTVAGARYTYELPDYANLLGELRNGYQVRVRTLPHLLGDRVWLYNFDGRDRHNLALDTYLCEAEHVRLTQAARAEQTPADRAALGHQLARRDNVEAALDARAAAVPAVSFTTPVPTLTATEAAAIQGAGYVGKALMQAAAQVADDTDTDPTDVRPAGRRRVYADHGATGARVLDDPDD